MLKSILKRDLLYLINIKKIILSLIVFTSIAGFTFVNLGDLKLKFSFSEFLILNTSGITIESSNFFDFLKWFLPIALFIFYISVFIYNEWEGRYLYSLIRIKSINIWIIWKIISISLVSFLYTFLYYIILIVFYGITIKNLYFNLNFKLLFFSFLLMSFLLLVLSTLVLLLSFIIKNSLYSYLVILIILLEPFFGSLVPKKLIPFLIGDNGMISRNTLFIDYGGILTFKWSFIYFLILELMLVFLTMYIAKRKDYN